MQGITLGKRYVLQKRLTQQSGSDCLHSWHGQFPWYSWWQTMTNPTSKRTRPHIIIIRQINKYIWYMYRSHANTKKQPDKQFVYINSYSASHGNWCTGTLWNRIITAQCEGMGEVGSARYEPALLPPCPSIRALSYSNCQRSSHSMSRWMFRNLAL